MQVQVYRRVQRLRVQGVQSMTLGIIYMSPIIEERKRIFPSTSSPIIEEQDRKRWVGIAEFSNN